ncbi:serine/threonine-protein kinase 11-interacting protein isoform X2 [Octopus sinensis]|uniref:Serine/threonine-protein kinase 11-interacting protein isoform X2 n=1 Tax=Octopus sinensis TaxID=2607531 RepID=A0A7E6ESX8_9MOLL|nr:serine/threonine-protein kinase 11-interacting protein isoform X2 [Octopus sinensis]
MLFSGDLFCKLSISKDFFFLLKSKQKHSDCVVEKRMTLETNEINMVHQLAEVVHYQSNKIFRGEGRLNLSTHTLVFLNQATQEGFLSSYHKEHDLTTEKQQELDKLKSDIHFVTDVLVDTTALKLYHQLHTIQGPLEIGMFQALTELNINRVPIHLIQGIAKLRSTLKQITISRSLQTLESLFEMCGGDRSGPSNWNHLIYADLSQNSIQKLDSSLRLLPALKYLDLSHNNIQNPERHLENLLYVEQLNLAFNHLTTLPPLSTHTKSSIKTLILRNNNLTDLNGVEELGYLTEFDASGNFLSDHSCLAVISGMHRLKRLSLFDNPMTYRSDHRSKSVGHISPLVNGDGIVLDGKNLNVTELKTVKRNKITKTASFYFRPHLETPLTEIEPNKMELEEKNDENLVERIKCRKIPVKRPKRKLNSPHGSISSVSIPDIKQLREFHGDEWLLYYENIRQDRECIMTHSAPASRKVSPQLKELPKPLPKLEYNSDTSIDEGPYLGHMSSEEKLFVDSDTEQSDEVSIITPPSEENDNVKEYPDSDEFKDDVVDFKNESHFGMEAEPWIVKLSSNENSEIFVSANERFLIEKDMYGQLLDRLDMKCLLFMSVLMRGSEYVVELKFDYVKSNRRERTYIMASKEESEELGRLLQPYLEAQAAKANVKEFLHFLCLKCSHEFSKEIGSSRREAESVDECQKCGSKNVVQQESPSSVMPSNNTPQESFSSTVKQSFLGLFSKDKSPSSGSSTPVNRDSPVFKRKFGMRKRSYSKSTRNSFYIGDSDVSQSSESLSSFQNKDEILDKARPASFHLEDSEKWLEGHMRSRSFQKENSKKNADYLTNKRINDNSTLVQVREKLKEHSSSPAICVQQRIHDNSSSLSATPPDSFLTSNVCHSMISSVYKQTLPSVTTADGNNLRIYVEDVDAQNMQVETEDENSSRTDRESSIQSIEELESGSRPAHDPQAEIISLSDSTDTNSDITALSEPVDSDIRKENSDTPCTCLDHQIQLFLVMKHLQHAERISSSIQCQIVQHIIGEYRGLLVLSTMNIFIFRLHGPNPSENPEKFVKLHSKHPITDVKYLDIGLGHQSLRFEFDEDCASYSFLIRDEYICRNFINVLLDLTKRLSNMGHMKPVQVCLYHHETTKNLSRLLKKNDDSENKGVDVDHPEKSISVYVLTTQLKDEKGEQKLPVSVALIGPLLYLIVEDHQWPMPRLQPRMPPESILPQFVIHDKQIILDITSLKLWKNNDKRLRLNFLNEISGCEFHWDFLFETNRGVNQLMQAVRAPWESEFGVNLEINVL